MTLKYSTTGVGVGVELCHHTSTQHQSQPTLPLVDSFFSRALFFGNLESRRESKILRLSVFCTKYTQDTEYNNVCCVCHTMSGQHVKPASRNVEHAKAADTVQIEHIVRPERRGLCRLSRSSHLDLRRMNPPLRHAEDRRCLALAAQQHLFKHRRMLPAPGAARDQRQRVVRPGRAARETSSAMVLQCRIPIVLEREKCPRR